ncbi:hypothetical protein [Lactiplantibacillus plantarum]|uniref:hypothetical protein n=1 Tax=Lactiplantibacillus plantarum TaxID=1590 RepID=UPI00155A6517|nr:hypothetical protein [Lactiplantibacillus plantarum]
MEVSHTTDGYWVLSGWIDEAIMKRAKQDFIKSNPQLDPSKVVIVNGEFKQASPKQFTLGDLAKSDREAECRSLTDDMIAVMTNQAKMKSILGQD